MARIDDCTFAVVDVETTGIDAGQDRIVEVAVLSCDWTGQVLDRFETLVRPDDRDLTGARREMLEDAPTFAEVAGDVLRRLGTGVVAGHNVSFDLRFLDAELRRIGVRLPTHRYVCTRELATVLGCDVTNRTLAALCAYFGVSFERWHTAADDTTATAAVLASLLARAVGYGRVELNSIEMIWSGRGNEWPVLAGPGRVLVRDPGLWPPGGDQPTSRRAKEASFRRLGEGPTSPSGAQVVHGDDSSGAGESASELWWQADLSGRNGIIQLESTIVPTFRANDDPELIGAVLALADLLRRHGGRDDEVRALFGEAFVLARRRGQWQPLNVLVEQWWSYLAALRDVDGQVELMLTCAGVAELASPIGQLTAQVAKAYPAEPVVAERLARRAMDALRERNDPRGAWEVLGALAQTLESAGHAEQAAALRQEAWIDGCDEAGILERLSAHLEDCGDDVRAVEVCARALANAPRAEQAPVVAAIRKRHRRCQQRLASSHTLFG